MVKVGQKYKLVKNLVSKNYKVGSIFEVIEGAPSDATILLKSMSSDFKDIWPRYYLLQEAGIWQLVKTKKRNLPDWF